MVASTLYLVNFAPQVRAGAVQTGDEFSV
jgi:hypothetical protein